MPFIEFGDCVECVNEGTKKEGQNFNDLLHTKIYPWLEQRIGYKRKKPFTDVDFEKHWITLFKPAFWILILDSIVNALYSTMFSYWPLVIIWSLDNDMRAIVGYGVLHLLLVFLRMGFGFVYGIVMQNLATNFEVSVARNFLVSDPINHATKSTGKITAKTNRAKSALEPLASAISFSIIPTLLQLFSVGAGFYAISFFVGTYATFSFVILTVILVSSRRFLFSPLLKWTYQYKDSMNATNLEILQQQNYIRTTMSSDIVMQKLSTMARKIISVLTTRRFSQNIYQNFFRLIWFVSFVGLLYLLFSLNLLDSGNEVAIGLLIAYITNAGNINQLSYTLTSVYERSVEIEDLYDYIRDFGSNSYPVLPINKN